MRWILQPGVALMRRMSNEVKLPLLSALFVAPFGMVLYFARATLPPALAAAALAFEEEARRLNAAVSAFKIRS